MTSTPIRMIAATMVVSFAVSFAVLWSRRAPPGGAAPIERTAASAPQLAASAPQIAPPGAGPRPTVTAVGSAPPTKAPSLPEVPPSDDTGPPLPVMLAVSTHPGPPHDEDSDGSALGRPTVARQVDLWNNSDQPLDITVLVVDVPTQESTRTALFVLPHAEAHVGTESGLKIETGNVVTLQSRGFSALAQTVP
jgi:hypothetical protein